LAKEETAMTRAIDRSPLRVGVLLITIAGAVESGQAVAPSQATTSATTPSEALHLGSGIAAPSVRLDGPRYASRSSPSATDEFRLTERRRSAARLIFEQPDAKDETTPSPTEAGAASDDAAELAKKLSNPVADLISVPFQLNYDDGYGPRDTGRVTLNIQPVIPISLNEDWNVISRTILPVIYQGSPAVGVESEFGLGDTVQSFFFSPKEPVGGWILGGGPVALIPTGTEPGLRNEQLGLGPTAVALRQDHGWTYGGLVNHIWGVTQSDDHDEVNATYLQPFVSYTWPTATSLTFNAEMTYDWTHDELTLPLNAMLSQLVKIGRQSVSFQIGGRYYLDAPPGGPEWGLRFTIVLLFPK
jgi:hypothetical protein